MSDISNLREAVETAREAFSRASEQQARSHKHALSLIHIVEEQLRDKRIELSQNDIQRERMTREYGQLWQMLHSLAMAVEVGVTETPGDDPKSIEVRPVGVLPLAPVVVANEPMVPATETVPDPLPQPARTMEGVAKAGVAKAGAGAEELRAGLKRMLKKKRIPVNGLEKVRFEAAETLAPAE